MTEAKFAGEVLERGASGYGAFAASRLVELHPEVAAQFGPDPMRRWKSQLTQRAVELAAALAAEEPTMFLARIAWSRKAFAARELGDESLRAGLECLLATVRESLPERAAEAAVEYVERALRSLDEPAPPDTSDLDPSHPPHRLALRYLQAGLEGDVRAAEELVIAAVDGGLPVSDAYAGVLLPAQREIGRLWHMGEISIAEEHLVTAATRGLMTILRHRAERAPANGRTLLAASVATNSHDIGLRATADLFEIAGWRAVFLGADVPASELAAALPVFDADLLLLAATLDTQVRVVADAIATVRAGGGKRVAVLVGGAAFDETPGLWQKVGADAYASRVDEALERAEALLET